jgi:hypothetical protein
LASIIVRPEDVHLQAGQAGVRPGAPEGRIVSVTFLGGELRYELAVGELRLTVRAAPRPRYVVGDVVRMKLARWHILPVSS